MTRTRTRYYETRHHVIQRIVQQFLRETGTSRATFGQNVADCYLDTVPLPLRGFEFHRGGDAAKAMRANGQLVMRCIEGEAVRFPAELEEFIVAALPAPYCNDLRVELVRRHGSYFTPVVDGRATLAGDDMAHVGEVMRAHSDTIKRVTDMLDDGVFDESDRADGELALEHIERAIGQLHSLAERIRVKTQPHLQAVTK